MSEFAGSGSVEVMLHYFLQVPLMHVPIELQQVTMGWMLTAQMPGFGFWTSHLA